MEESENINHKVALNIQRNHLSLKINQLKSRLPKNDKKTTFKSSVNLEISEMTQTYLVTM